MTTARERAAEVCKRLQLGNIAEIWIADAIEQAVAAEREACAKVAEDQVALAADPSWIVAKIRDRSYKQD